MTITIIPYLLLHLISVLYQSNGLTMKMFTIEPSHLQTLSQSSNKRDRQQFQFLIDLSLSRALYGQRRDPKVAPNAIQSPMSYIQGSYLVTKLNFANPEAPYTANVLIDTFSDLTWIQCIRCDPCFVLSETFNVTGWSSYSRMSVDDARCVPKKYFSGSCGFDASLGNAHTEGYLGKGTFIFDNANLELQYYPNLAFGCGIRNNDFSFQFEPNKNNEIAGVMGLSPGPKSFITQLDMVIKGRFSYCLAPKTPYDASKATNTTLISFGDKAKIGGDDEKVVETIALKPDARYHLYLAAILVDGVRLNIDPAVFALNDKDYSSGGFFIDPGTPITVLAKPAYAVVRRAMVDHFNKYGWHPIERPDTYDLCYTHELEGFEVYPTFAFSFVKSLEGKGEVQLVIPPENLFIDLGVNDGFCLNMMPSDGSSIFGAIQQTNYRFLFDLKDQLLSFIQEKC